MIRRNTRSRRKGAIAVLAACFLIVIIAIVAFAVDMGYVLVGKAELQRAADAAAHAAVLEYRSDDDLATTAVRIRNTASQYVEDNTVLNSSASVAKNWFNADNQGDLLLGRIDFAHPSAPMTFDDPAGYNAVRVRIRRSATRNGEVPLFFARVLGHQGVELDAEATAAIMQRVGGFKIPASGENIPFLPITIKQEYWDALLNNDQDDWSWDLTDQTISEKSDGIPEVTLFPNETGSAGNFGTVNVGTSANSTDNIAGQIRNGLTQSDLDYHGGTLELNSSGELNLTGDPGLSASLKDDLQAMAGKPRTIPLYREVAGTGNNAAFVITKFVGVRVMAVNLSSGDKFVSVQPANVTFKGIIQAESGSDDTSDNIYSPPVIVQ